MLAYRPASERGVANMGWLQSRHSFSFGHYYDPNHMGFGPLRVINDDRVQAGAGFPKHGVEIQGVHPKIICRCAPEKFPPVLRLCPLRQSRPWMRSDGVRERGVWTECRLTPTILQRIVSWMSPKVIFFTLCIGLTFSNCLPISSGLFDASVILSSITNFKESITCL